MMSRPMALWLRSGLLDVEDVHVVRVSLEVQIPGLAAGRATEADLTAMAESIDSRALLDSHSFAAGFVSIFAVPSERHKSLNSKTSLSRMVTASADISTFGIVYLL